MAVIAGTILALFIAAGAFVYLGRRGAAPGVVGRVLRVLALAAAAGIAVALLPFTIDDSGAAATYLLGVPVIATAAALLADLTHRGAGITTAAAAVVTLVWALLLGLGIGLWFAIPALLLGAAAVAGVAPRRAQAS